MERYSMEMATIIANIYDGHQQARIANFNRIRGLLRKRLEGLDLNIPEDKKEDSAFINRYIDKNLSDLIIQLMSKEKELDESEKKFIAEFSEVAKQTKDLEKKCIKMMDYYLAKEPIFAWLTNIKGISSVLSIRLIRNFGYCEEAGHLSSIWKYAGLDVMADGRGRRKVRGEKLAYNPEAKRVAWIIGDSFIKQRTEPYRTVYDHEKERWENTVFKEGELLERYGKPYKAEDTKLSKGHIDNRARRKIEKIFLAHYIVVARKMIGKPIDDLYVKEKLGHEHIIEPPFTENLSFKV